MREYDRYFVDVLRDETGVENLDVVWRPDIMRVNSEQRGCWVVTMAIRECKPFVMDDGAVIIASDIVQYDVYVLNGNHGRPMTPGRWVIEDLLESDRARKGIKRRAKEMDDWREAKVVAQQEARDRYAYAAARDPLFRKMLVKQAESQGMATPDDGEMLALERKAMKAAERLAMKDAAERKEVRFMDGRVLHR